MNILGHIESILFVASKPLTIGVIAKAIQKNPAEVEEAIENLVRKWNMPDSGVHILVSGDSVQMASNPDHAAVIDGFVKDEIAGELTRAQLETLTVVAYRGPVTRPELEQIRGVNCALIVRNLLVRGLIEEKEDAEKLMPVYMLSLEALRHLGITRVAELPEYDTLHSHAHLDHALQGNLDGE